jgi:hypothetical protein
MFVKYLTTTTGDPDVMMSQLPRHRNVGSRPPPPQGPHQRSTRRQLGKLRSSVPSAAASPSDVPPSLSRPRLHSVFTLPADLPAPLAPTAVYGQPRPPPRSATWGAAVARRHLMTVLSSADPYILFIFKHATCRQLFT